MKIKKQNQRIIIICAIAIVAIAATIIILTTKKENNNQQQMGQNDSYKVQKVEPPVKELPEEKDSITLYIGESKIPAKYNKNAEKQEQIKRILEKIGLSIGYKIEINKAEIDNEKIVIDFKETSAPFNDSAYFGNEEEGMFIENYNKLVYTIFESIKQTLNNTFGENLKIYYTVNGQSKAFNNITPRLVISREIEYK